MVDKIEIKDNFEIEIKGEKEGNKDIITDKPRECNFLITSDEYVHDYEWTDEMEERAKKLLAEDLGTIENPKTKEILEVQSKNWEKFYKFNKTNFFKDRHYILREFEELKNDDRVSLP